MRILITGGRGQLAADLVKVFPGHEVTALSRAELDVTDSAQISAAFVDHQPDVVINTAAFHRVDLCETEPEQSFLVNAAAPQRLAAACRDAGAVLVHITTDYVFSGAKRRPYAEDDPVDPISVYGASKAAGELAVRATLDQHIIARTTGLYGLAGRSTPHGNFVERMLTLAQEGKPLRVVSDQVLTPSYTRDVALMIASVLEAGARGTFHLTNSGECSWYQFAAAIFRLAEIEADLSPIGQGAWKVPARRPAYSVLAHEGLRRLGLPEPRPWEEALQAYLQERTAEDRRRP